LFGQSGKGRVPTRCKEGRGGPHFESSQCVEDAEKTRVKQNRKEKDARGGKWGRGEKVGVEGGAVARPGRGEREHSACRADVGQPDGRDTFKRGDTPTRRNLLKTHDRGGRPCKYVLHEVERAVRR
jgi:hypothetical protein